MISMPRREYFITYIFEMDFTQEEILSFLTIQFY